MTTRNYDIILMNVKPYSKNQISLVFLQYGNRYNNWTILE